MTTRCRACHAAITWVETPAGRKMPVDAGSWREGDELARRVAGEVVVTPDGRVVTVKTDGELVAGGTSHWSSCPNADDFRRRSDATKRAAEKRSQNAGAIPRLAACTLCGAPIEWRRTKNGVACPVNPGVVEIINGLGYTSHGEVLHTTTCVARRAQIDERVARQTGGTAP